MKETESEVDRLVAGHEQEPATVGLVIPLFHALVRKWDEMNARNVERNGRLDALEARCKSLEERPALEYKGVWQPDGEPYLAGQLVTSSGSLWIARRATTQRPGDPDSGWTLCVKHGKDGKDGRDAR